MYNFKYIKVRYQIPILIKNTNILYFGIFSYLVCILLRLPVAIFKYIFNINDIDLAEKISHKAINVDLIINALFFAPLIETLLFQCLFYYIYVKFIKNFWIIVLLSGVAFGLIHTYSVFYVINTFLIGVYFMYAYLIRAKYKRHPFVSIMFAHFFMNLITLILSYFKFGFDRIL